MRAFIATLGTRGDFELFFMLARELQRRNHEVVLGSSPFYRGRVNGSLIEWVEIGDGTLEELLGILKSLDGVPDKTKRTFAYYQRWLRPQLAGGQQQIARSAAGADYFVSNLKLTLRRHNAIIPSAFVTYDPPRSVAELAKYGAASSEGRILEIVALPQMLVDPGNCWGSDYHFTGFWNPPEQGGWSAPAGVQAFLKSGPAPVVVTMGSMVMFGRDRFVRDVLAALGLVGQRGIFVGGWSGSIDTETMPPFTYFVPEIPYDWLFPQASCIVHHGGCGTVAAVLRAGKPSVVLPQVICQEVFGRMLADAGVATGVFDMHDLSPDRLAGAIGTAISDAQVSASAQRWQDCVSHDGGVEAAVSLMEEHWSRVTTRV